MFWNPQAMFTSRSKQQPLYFWKTKLPFWKRRVSPNHVCYVSGLPQATFCCKATCLFETPVCFSCRTNIFGKYFAILINVPTYRTVLRIVRYCIPTHPYRIAVHVCSLGRMCRSRESTSFSSITCVGRYVFDVGGSNACPGNRKQCFSASDMSRKPGSMKQSCMNPDSQKYAVLYGR